MSATARKNKQFNATLKFSQNAKIWSLKLQLANATKGSYAYKYIY